MNIQIDKLSFTYPTGVTALQALSLTIQAGEQVALIGQNGSGKTTLAKQLNGLLHPTQGTVQIGPVGHAIGRAIGTKHDVESSVARIRVEP